ncbi:MAG TPA: ribosomal-processing cysteine protease Prp [Tissierellaceae bacterium]|nr:ribosomal-processing cysteine protease Prp [Tissierellaceae bacterium]
MITVRIVKDCLGNIKGFNIKGHAGYAAYGEDIVCSAVSILSHTALLSLVKVAGIEEKDIKYKVEEEKGYLIVTLPKKINKESLDKAQIILQSFELGIGSITEAYPKHVRLQYEEVREC